MCKIANFFEIPRQVVNNVFLQIGTVPYSHISTAANLLFQEIRSGPLVAVLISFNRHQFYSKVKFSSCLRFYKKCLKKCKKALQHLQHFTQNILSKFFSMKSFFIDIIFLLFQVVVEVEEDTLIHFPVTDTISLSVVLMTFSSKKLLNNYLLKKTNFKSFASRSRLFY